MYLQPRATGACLLALAAILASCDSYNPREFSPTAPATTEALTLTTAAAAIPADGFSRVEITAQISPEAAPDRRTVVFTTTAGKFVGATENEGRRLSVPADTTGAARVQLQSTRVIQTAVVEASVSAGNQVLIAKRTNVDFVAVGPSDLVQISASRSSAPADGASTVRVFADIAPGLPADQRTVTFTTTLGTFADTNTRTTTVTADSGNRATVDLVSPATVGQARVTATVAQTSVQTTVDFTAALPEDIIVSPDKTSLKASLDDSTTVMATLLRRAGTVTRGTVVTYQVVDAAPPHRDLNFIIRSVTPSDETGKSQAVIIAGNTTFRGTATIRATVGQVSGEANIQIVNP